ncbi:MAG: VOC family protein [Chloroflexota bacterium]|nr:VOC family protein [Chloroflexota bacterium]
MSSERSQPDGGTVLFERLDFLYMPSRNVAAEARYFTHVLGGRLVFAVEDMGTRVAMLQLTDDSPRLLLADHLDGERPILVYRVADLRDALAQLERRGWKAERTFQIPHGPCCSFRTEGGHRIALYQLTRPGVERHFEGRHDF